MTGVPIFQITKTKCNSLDVTLMGRLPEVKRIK